METINKRTEMNEVQILGIESRMKMTNHADEHVENKPQTFTGEHKSIYFDPNDYEV